MMTPAQRTPAASRQLTTVVPAAFVATSSRMTAAPAAIAGGHRARSLRPKSARLEASAIQAAMVVPAQATLVGFAQTPGAAADAVSRDESARKPIARKVAGFLTGDGSYTVRPFPTVATDGRR